ncbi:hypothetical protein FJ364_04360 [Candidatus Dependentiae bacterium]|nr:hypothetical protein [Candidatus Dependentiae bacterium]
MNAIIALFALTQILVFSTPSYTENNRLVIIADERESESPLHKNPSTALTKTLTFFVEAGEAPILVSRSVLHQYALNQARKYPFQHPEHVCFAYKICEDDEQTKNSSYYVIIPKKHYHARTNTFAENNKKYGKQLALNALFGLRTEVLGNILTQERQNPIHTWGELATYLAAKKGLDEGFKSEFWVNLFFAHEHVVEHNAQSLLKPWNILFFAHGSPTATSGIDVYDLRKFLLFCSEELTTKIVSIISCYIGGSLKDTLCTSIHAQSLIFNFDLLIPGINDVPLFARLHNTALIKNFFEEYETSDQPDPAVALNILTQLITPSDEALSFGQFKRKDSLPFEIPVQQNLTQITPSKDIPKKSGRNCYALSYSPLRIDQSRAVVLRQNTFTRPLELKPVIRSSVLFPHPLICADYYLEDFCKKNEVFDKTSHPASHHVKKIINLYKRTLAPDSNQSGIITNLFFPHTLFYPNIISTIYNATERPVAEPYSTHLIEEVQLSNTINSTTNPFIGILRFFRDSFFSHSARHSKNIICIKTLKGNNDISLLLECMDVDDKNHNELENILRPLAQEHLELKNVIIKTEKNCDTKTLHLYVAFTFNQYQKQPEQRPRYLAWESTTSMPEYPSESDLCLWSFKKIGIQKHNRNFAEIVTMMA